MTARLSSPQPATRWSLLASDAPAWREWAADEPIVRVHDSAFGATEPHPGPGRGHSLGRVWPRTRFAHFRSTETIAWVPSIYGADSDVTAIAEVVLRGQDLHPASGRVVHLREATFRGHVISTIAPTRTLQLIDVSGTALTTGGPGSYPTTVPAAAELHAANRDADGMVWTSRQHPDGQACVLWVDEPGGRVRLRRTELSVVAPPVPVAVGPGRDRVLAAAEALGVMVVATSS